MTYDKTVKFRKEEKSFASIDALHFEALNLF